MSSPVLVEFRALKVVVLVAFGVALCMGQMKHLGPCPEIPTAPYMNLSQMVGMWYEYERFPNMMEIGDACSKINITFVSGRKFKMVTTAYNNFTKTTTSIDGEGIQDPKVPGNVSVKIGTDMRITPYYVVATNSKTVVMTWRCIDLKVFHMELVWLLTREPGVIDIDTEKWLKFMLQQYNVDPGQFQLVQQTQCPH